MHTNPSKQQLTRIAPTPSGYLHLGNVLSFAITYALAQKHGANIMLRIDDLDQNRVKNEYIKDIFETLWFMEIPWQYGPKNEKEYQDRYSQLHRMGLYHDALEQLVQKKLVYACNCSRKEISQTASNGIYPRTCRPKNLDLSQKTVNWRIKTNQEQLFMKDENEGVSRKLPAVMQDFVIRKKDGAPAYQLASVVDDIHFGINLVVRGKDLYDSSWAQLFLANQLPTSTFNSSLFYHHPLVEESGGKKLSKSAGSTSVKGLRAAGKTKEYIYGKLGEFMGFDEHISSLDDFEKAYNQKKLP
ncbi:glutamate--tRNA ligase family protein [Echinicola strongylocentroti]|uniref:glutamate--tRNA ligase family protein n=1 Tax=Echinicola strongylocentroti TaxID=1795355 RepID=UPI00147432E9|nr:glutamate--tRNA ligase family protein [Echinicola strongylocentroti]